MYRIGQEELAELQKVIETQSLFKVNQGLQESAQVEEKLRNQFACKHAIFMTSGHAALVAALVALGIGPGDEVIVPAYTYIATAMAVVQAGAIPILAEADDTLTISPEDVEAKITSRTKAVIPVHIQGFPCNMAAITAIAQKHGIYVIEDACQADGGTFNGKRLGTIGDIGALSFNYFKIITCGEGGALLTNNKVAYERALIYHDSSAVAFFGNQMDGFETKGFCGSEYRSNELCAAVLNVQLTRMDNILTDLRKNKRYMMEKLADVCRFIPSNDLEGDCGTTLALQFENETQTLKFKEVLEGLGGTRPYDTGKHVYTRWEPIMEKRGALNPLMDPFKMEANKDIVPDYREDMCPETLVRLAKVFYVSINPDDTVEKLDQKIACIRTAMNKL